MKRDSSCPLCGAKMAPTELLDACWELANAELGVLSARCPYCQGALEIRPADDRIDVGYCVGTDDIRFDVVISLPCLGLRVSRSASGLVLKAAERNWTFPV